MMCTVYVSALERPPRVVLVPLSGRSTPYLRVPDRLLRAFAHDPIAIGVYLLVARCAVANQGPVPLSPADLTAWAGLPSNRRAGVMRRLKQLIRDEWIMTSCNGGAVKRLLCPTWGSDEIDEPVAWDWALPDLGKPSRIRARRIPADLLDAYLGRLDPQPGRRPGVITRYFDRPLLDLDDLGTYALCTLVAAEPTLRMRQLGLFVQDLPALPASPSNLLTQAAQGRLLVPNGETAVAVWPSPAGWRMLGKEAFGVADEPNDATNESDNDSPSRSPSDSFSESDSGSLSDSPNAVAASGSHSDSPNGSHSGSLTPLDLTIDFPAPGQGKSSFAESQSACSMESMEGMESESESPPTPHNEPTPLGGGNTDRERISPDSPSDESWHRLESLAGGGTEDRERISSDFEPEEPWQQPEPLAGGGTADRESISFADETTERDALLHVIGIRQRHQMRDVPLDLLRAWNLAVQHPGMTARIADPAAFACSQLRQGNPPPSERELDRWTGAGTQHDDDRYFPPAEIDLERHAALLAQARELVGHDDRELIAYVLAGLEEGLESAVALQEAATSLAHLQRPVSAVEEVDHGL